MPVLTMKRANVLFLCNHNSARSQMAEALLRHYASDRFDACSAGLEPRPIQKLAIEAMKEVGIDLSGQRSKSTLEFLGRTTIHHAIFLCPKSEADCPRIYPFAQKVDYWNIVAPSTLEEQGAHGIEAFRTVRDDIDRRIRAWVQEVSPNRAT